MIKDTKHSELSLKIKEAKKTVTYLIEQIKANKIILSKDKINKDNVSYSIHSLVLAQLRGYFEDKSKELVHLKSERKNYQHNLGIEKRDADLAERNLKFID